MVLDDVQKGKWEGKKKITYLELKGRCIACILDTCKYEDTSLTLCV